MVELGQRNHQIRRSRVNFLARLLGRPQPKRPADVVIAHRVESDRARKAAAEKQAKERAACLAKAATLGKATTPMTPRWLIAAEVQIERLQRKVAEGRHQ